MLRAVARQGPAGWLFLTSVCVIAAAQEATVRWLRLPVACRLAGATLQLDAGPGDADPADGWDLLTPRERHRCETALKVLDRGPFNATCLRRSLLLAHLLRRHDPVVRVGVAKRAEKVQAHAWVEIHGRTLDPERDQYLVLAPAAGGADDARPAAVDAPHARISLPARDSSSAPEASRARDALHAGGDAA